MWKVIDEQQAFRATWLTQEQRETKLTACSKKVMLAGSNIWLAEYRSIAGFHFVLVKGEYFTTRWGRKSLVQIFIQGWAFFAVIGCDFFCLLETTLVRHQSAHYGFLHCHHIPVQHTVNWMYKYKHLDWYHSINTTIWDATRQKKEDDRTWIWLSLSSQAIVQQAQTATAKDGSIKRLAKQIGHHGSLLVITPTVEVGMGRILAQITNRCPREHSDNFWKYQFRAKHLILVCCWEKNSVSVQEFHSQLTAESSGKFTHPKGFGL